MIKNLLVATMLSVAPNIQNLNNEIVKQNITININDHVENHDYNYYKVMRKVNQNTGMGYVQALQYEDYDYDEETDEPMFEVRTTFTIIKVTGTLDNISINQYLTLNLNNYTSDDDRILFYVGYYEGTLNNVDTLLNETSQYQWSHTGQIVSYVYQNSVLQNNIFTQPSTQITGNGFNDDIQTKYGTIYEGSYYIFLYGVLTNHNYTDYPEDFRNPSNLQQGYLRVMLTTKYNVNLDTVNYEVVDIGGLMWTILGMPFTFVSTAFNFTFFAGTPYAINVANILFTVLGALMLIFIIRKVTK